jgi:biopolymer transport protein ExbD
MKKLFTVCAACLIVITAVLVHRAWSEYRRDQEAASALASIEANKPPRFKTIVPPEDATGSNSTDRLVVSIDDSGALRLNSEDAGTLDDLSRLRVRLEQALKERGGARPDRIVFVKASSRLKYNEVRKVVDVVKGAGADPVGLEMDAPQ